MTENQTPDEGATATLPPEQPQRRRLDQLARVTDDPMVSGVSAGIARHFDIDPIIVRVAFVALSVVGLAGLILYLGLWFFLPYDDGRRSIAADFFRLGEREPEARKVGLVVTAVLSAAAVFGDSGWFWGGPAWGILAFAGLFWLFVARPRKQREQAVAVAEGRAPAPAKQRPLLFGLTAAVAAVALGGLWLYGELADEHVGTGTYLATALVVVGLGLVLGAWWGRSGGLVAIGIGLVVALSLSYALPSGDVGDERHRPETASELRASYEHGLGRFELNLSDLADEADALAGRTVHIETGIGETVIHVPEGLPVTVHAEEEAGRIDVFERSADGQGPDLTVTSEDPDALVLDIDQTFGHIRVVHS